MVVDSSAIIAVIFEEQDQSIYLDALRREKLAISASTLFECRLVALRKSGPVAEAELLAFIAGLNIEIVSFDTPQAALAAAAFRRYGKGLDKAVLNFGDCFSYALAKSRGEPLLYKGGDFARTDLAAAV